MTIAVVVGILTAIAGERSALECAVCTTMMIPVYYLCERHDLVCFLVVLPFFFVVAIVFLPCCVALMDTVEVGDKDIYLYGFACGSEEMVESLFGFVTGWGE